MTTKFFQLYIVTNYYGNKILAIAREDAMPARFDKIILKGTFEECNTKLNAINFLNNK